MRLLHTLCLAHYCINHLQNTNRERCGLAGTRLGLCNRIAAFANLHDRSRLYCWRRLVSICVNSSQQVLFQMHVLKRWRNCDLFRGRKLHALCHMSAPVPFEGVLLVLPSARRSIPSAIVIDSSPTAKDVQRSRLPAPRGRKVGFGGGWPPAPLFNHVTRYRNFADAEDLTVQQVKERSKKKKWFSISYLPWTQIFVTFSGSSLEISRAWFESRDLRTLAPKALVRPLSKLQKWAKL